MISAVTCRRADGADGADGADDADGAVAVVNGQLVFLGHLAARRRT